MGAFRLGTPIEGLLVFQLEVHGDQRGWFKENWRKDQFESLGLPPFSPVQQNMSFNARAGSTRGFHAEPWNKLVSVAQGKVFGAWVDLREGAGFGTVWTLLLEPSTTVFVPKGVANAYQTISEEATYSYLVDGYWRAGVEYTMVNLRDDSIAIDWPIHLDDAVLSEKDLAHAFLRDITPISRKPKALVLGANGQVGKAISPLFEQGTALTRIDLDITKNESLDRVSWDEYDVVINAAAYTNVDLAEREPGKQICWNVNVDGVAALVEKCRGTGATFVQFSSDYVFDGTSDLSYDEHASAHPLNLYGLSKLIGDKVVATLPKHYILRTSWVVGDGHNFVKTMMGFARESRRVTVVDDQFGRLTFASDLARAVKYLLEKEAPFGTYNITSSGPLLSWFELAKMIYSLVGADADLVSPTTSSEYSEGKVLASRPRNSDLCLDKLLGVGFELTDQLGGLEHFITNEHPYELINDPRQAAR